MFAVFFLLVGVTVAAEKQAAPLLFGSVKSISAGETLVRLNARRLATVESRILKLNTSAMKQIVGGKTRFNTTISLNLLDTSGYVAKMSKTTSLKAGAIYGTGTLDGKPGSFVSMLNKGDRLSANIYVPSEKAIYEIRPTGVAGETIVRRIDPSKLGDDSEIPIVNLGAAVNQRPLFQPGTAEINVMAFYTAAAKTGAGGKNMVEDEIELAVAEANMAYENSGILQHLNLVRTEEIAYTEKLDSCADLDSLASTTDKVIDTVHAKRRQYNADIVTLFIDQSAPGNCGCGYVMRSNNDNNFSPFAFNVIKTSCIANLSYAHELGHNMGAAHDTANAATPGMYDYSYGYQDPASLFRTVMAYDCAAGCVRVPVFSGPNNTYDTKVAGVADQSDNSRTLNNNRFMAARFMDDLRVLKPGEWALMRGLRTLEKLPAARTEAPAAEAPATRLVNPEATRAISNPSPEKGTLIIGESVDREYMLGSTDANRKIQQFFKLPAGALIDSVSFRIGRVQMPTQALRISIFEVATGKELGLTTLSYTKDKESLPGSPADDSAWYKATFRKPIATPSDASKSLSLTLSVAAANSVRYYIVGASNSSYPEGNIFADGFADAAFDVASKVEYHMPLLSQDTPGSWTSLLFNLVPFLSGVR